MSSNEKGYSNEPERSAISDRLHTSTSSEKGYSNEVEQFIKSCRLRALEDCRFGIRSDAQAQKLAIQIKLALKNPENRNRVLQAITGLPIISQNELTFWYHHVLIDETLEAQDAAILRSIEAYIEERPDCQAWEIFPWYRPLSNMSDLQLANYA